MSSIDARSTEAFEDHYAEKNPPQAGDSMRWTYFWGALAAMAIPMMVPYLLAMWDQPHYQYFPFVFVVVGFLAWQRSDKSLHEPRGFLAWSLIGCGLLGLVAAVFLPSAWMAGLSFVLLATACLHSLRSAGSGRSLLGLAIPLIMLVQAPVGLDNMLITRLQRITTQLGSVTLDIIGVPHAVSGNILQLADRELFVAEACSGIQSVFTLAFLACVIVVWRQRRGWLTPLYLLISVILAVAGNTLRVTMVAVAHHFWGLDWASGFQHDLLGYFTLALAGLFLLSFDHLVQTVLHPVSSDGRDSADNLFLRAYNYFVSDFKFSNDDEGTYGNYGRREQKDEVTNRADWLNGLIMNKVGWIATMVIIGICFVASLVQSTRVEVNRAPELLLREVVLFEPQPELLASSDLSTIEITDHQVTRDGSEPRLGQNADLWGFNAGNLSGQIVVSQTYSGWHELCVCYQNMNWQLLDRDVTEPIEILSRGKGQMEAKTDIIESDASGDESFVTARFRREDGNYGYLFFTAVHEDGSIPDAPSTYGAFGSRFLSRLERYGAISQQNLVMLQMWVVSPEKIPRKLLDALRVDFVQIRSRVSEQLDPSPASTLSMQLPQPVIERVEPTLVPRTESFSLVRSSPELSHTH
ncbi:MAG: exosortase U [Planctomycetota bacterium]